jgi:hypothetical protein
MGKKATEQPIVELVPDEHGTAKESLQAAKARNNSLYGKLNTVIRYLNKLREKYPRASGVCVLQAEKTDKFLRCFVNLQGADAPWCHQLSWAIQQAILTKCHYPASALNTEHFTSTLDRSYVDRFLHGCFENGIISKMQHTAMVKYARQFAQGAEGSCFVFFL